MFCAELLCLRGRGKSKKFLFLLRLPPWGSWHDEVVSEGVFIPPHCGFLHPLLCGGLQTPFLMCTFFFEKKVRKKAIREVSRNPLKSSRRSFSATSALPKQRREWSSNLKAFLIVRSFGAFGDGRKRKSFLKPIIEVFCILSFRAWQHKNRDEKSPLFAFHKVCSNQLLKFLLPAFFSGVKSRNGDEKLFLFAYYKIFSNQIIEVSFAYFSFQRKVGQVTEPPLTVLFISESSFLPSI